MSLGPRFWAKVEKTESCWLWRGAATTRGYGTFRVGRSMKAVHRLAWEDANGAVPSNLHVLHACDVRNCVNPSHLFLGTHEDNMADRSAKGRQHRKLTPAQVVEIRARYIRGGATHRSLAEVFGVSHRAIGDAVRGRSWAHLKPHRESP